MKKNNKLFLFIILFWGLINADIIYVSGASNECATKDCYCQAGVGAQSCKLLESSDNVYSTPSLDRKKCGCSEEYNVFESSELSSDSIPICGYVNIIKYKNGSDASEDKTFKLGAVINYSLKDKKFELVYDKLKLNNKVDLKSKKSSTAEFTTYTDGGSSNGSAAGVIDSNKPKDAAEEYTKEVVSNMLTGFNCPEFIDLPIRNDSSIGFYKESNIWDYQPAVGKKTWETTTFGQTYNIKTEINEIAESVADSYLTKLYFVDTTKSLEENSYCKGYKNQAENDIEKYQKEFEQLRDAELIKQIFKGWSVTSLPKWVFSEKPGYEKFKELNASYSQDAKSKCEEVIKNDTSIDEEKKQEIIDDFNNYHIDVSSGLGNYANMHIGSIYDIDWNGEENCAGFLGSKSNSNDPAYYLDLVFKIMKYGAVILVFSLSIMDFIKAITSQDKQILNKAINNSVKRLVLAVLMFFLPIIIEFVLSLLGAYSTCEIGFQ